MNNVTKLYDITNSFLVTLYLLYCVLCLYIIDFNSVLEQTVRKHIVLIHLMNILGLQTWPTCGLVTTANDRTIDLINRIREDKVDTTRQTPPVVGEFFYDL